MWHTYRGRTFLVQFSVRGADGVISKGLITIVGDPTDPDSANMTRAREYLDSVYALSGVRIVEAGILNHPLVGHSTVVMVHDQAHQIEPHEMGITGNRKVLRDTDDDDDSDEQT